MQPNTDTGLTQFTIQQSATMISPWQNPVNKFDVNFSGAVTPLDALIVINELLLGFGGPLATSGIAPPPYTAGNGFYVNVNGDGKLSPLNALQVINFLNDPTAGQNTVTPGATPSATPAAAVAAATPATANAARPRRP